MSVNGSNNAQGGYSAAFQAAFPYLTAANAGQQAQQPGPLQNIPGGADAAGTEFAGVGIATVGQTNPGSGVEPGSKVVNPSQYQTDLAANPNAISVSRAPSVISRLPSF